ncbi:hypothetical protein EVAR_55729_1 [Eumeta japonica]|uniref:Secreted protein n=1 Tax=Eumeta variegata TaxID=151549 RepID=A0A4C1Z224_EUMVA|nr:hypothetical protein EVAR_55729_1 [Eumeta japonica]
MLQRSFTSSASLSHLALGGVLATAIPEQSMGDVGALHQLELIMWVGVLETIKGRRRLGRHKDAYFRARFVRNAPAPSNVNVLFNALRKFPSTLRPLMSHEQETPEM